jgi:hypothetical protein
MFLWEQQQQERTGGFWDLPELTKNRLFLVS